MSIKSKKKLLGLMLPIVALYGCNGSGGGNTQNSIDKNNDPVIEQPKFEQSQFKSESWPFEEELSHLVAAAKVAGYYAVANASSMTIEIRDISKSVLHTVSFSDIRQLLPDMQLTHDTPLCGMTFTPSGRFLYFAVCNVASPA